MSNRITLDQLVADALSPQLAKSDLRPTVDAFNGYTGPIYPRENQMDPESLAQLDAWNAERGVLTHFLADFTTDREIQDTREGIFDLLEQLS